MEALQATNLVVGTRSNSKPSRFHDHPLLKSMKYRREVVADLSREKGSRSDSVCLSLMGGTKVAFIHQARCGLPRPRWPLKGESFE